ncbi:GNAT family N-acetyltransferase [Halolamina sp. CBA1230]|uniref:GNAT family N-acetyltransferase n=1 Tax=Halolamina sp. CBA1230 TaxID=1853690 RepID=UPI0009A1B378|nr:GNAT family N-acetyltransferase [Halolamina sp. CBA1230]QKY19605.1 GNAT family N-acetyltransferase [Halolamina sp. CBA1230]
MTLAPDTDDRIARHWAERLDCAPGAFADPGVTVTTNPNEGTIRLVRRGETLVVAAPETVRDALDTHREALADAELPATEVVERALTDHDAGVDAVHGPYFLGYVDEPSFSPADTDARLLVGADRDAFDRLQERVTEDEWARASPVFRPGQTAGLFRDDNLIAVATLTHLPFPDVGVVVDPEHRGQGYGREVASKITATAFDVDRDTVVRYRTLDSDSASVALAASLGYERWATGAVLVLDQGSP